MISDEEINKVFAMAHWRILEPRDVEYSKAVQKVVERLRSAEEALKFYASDDFEIMDYLDGTYSINTDVHKPARAHFEKVKDV